MCPGQKQVDMRIYVILSLSSCARSDPCPNTPPPQLGVWTRSYQPMIASATAVCHGFCNQKLLGSRGQTTGTSATHQLLLIMSRPCHHHLLWVSCLGGVSPPMWAAGRRSSSLNPVALSGIFLGPTLSPLGHSPLVPCGLCAFLFLDDLPRLYCEKSGRPKIWVRKHPPPHIPVVPDLKAKA